MAWRFLETERRIWSGQTILRICMNRAFAAYTLSGRTIDVGGGRDPDYFDYFRKGEGLKIEVLDASLSGIDFEKDPLPYESGSADTVVCANVLEHIYNYRFLAGEICRILKDGGALVGFVPFLLQYHPDPHDYFRYTDESLVRIFRDAGFGDVRIERVGGGPFLVNFNTIMLSIPRPLTVLLYPWYSLFDRLFLKLRPAARKRYPLGFVFSARKAAV